ncbi:riboflavin synthase [Tripterygium wilfordii]|uniref:Riboflavin synthase n=1 Tax=Tripterygium wilfordii TaxID=458696 RepID=A0A7J7BWX8_TRIWF|nr:riboflavin synthase [Tripterygium wilfordii]KAF5726383.1 riboflavin synthase [Tripterygium wilfordii]
MAVSFSLTSLTKNSQFSPSKLKKPTKIFNLLRNPSNFNLGFTSSISKPSPLFVFTKSYSLPRFANKTQKFLPKNPNQIRCLFTGIVEEMGQVKQLGTADHGGFDMTIGAQTVLQDVHLGDSIAVNGTCLTVTEFDNRLGEFKVGIAPETLRKTSLSELEPGSLVNLERAMLPTTRMGGHFVQGHVDGTGEIVAMDPEEDSLWVKVKVNKELLKYVVPKGFIAVDGTSLTVVDVSDEEGCFNFMLVTYTQQHVVIPLKKVGQKVNLEVDILGKYVERLLSSGFLDSIKSN